MIHPPLVPAEPAAAGDGTPYSTRYGDIYHPAQGASAQAHHVFLAGNGLPARWMDVERFVILETGFGLGLNFFATWQSWRTSRARGRLHFISVEKHPFRRDDLARLLAAHPELEHMVGQLLRQWPPPTPGFHRLQFDDGRIALTLLFGDAQAMLPQLSATVDAVFLDGFAPAKNPELWSRPLLADITRLCRPDASLATWSVAGDLRQALEGLAWTLLRRPGFGAKREMLCATRASAVVPAPTPDPHPTSGSRHAIVIGAGLAGIAIAERLAARGWQVELFERHAQPAQEASGNPSGILLPHLAKDDAVAARLSRACYLYALRRLGDLDGVRWSPCGVLQVARDGAHEDLQRSTVRELKLPPDFAAFLEHDAAAALIGHAVAHGGWWFPGGGWVSPASLCTALLTAGGRFVDAYFGIEVAALRQTSSGWQALDESGRLLASAPHLILANAHAANRLLAQTLPLMAIRGQVSYLPPQLAEAMRPPLRHVVCRAGYITPPAAGTVCIGASFDRNDTDLKIRASDHAGNLQRLEELLPGAVDSAAVPDAARLEGRVGVRTATPDRLPLIGTLADTEAITDGNVTLDTLPRHAGLHVLLGLSARGMVWAPLAAELLASQLDGEPSPVELDLQRAVDPARIHLRALRRRTAGL